MAGSEIQPIRITTELEADSALLPDSVVCRAAEVRCEDGRIVASGRSSTGVLPPESIVHELRDADLHSPDGVIRILEKLGLDFARPLDLVGLGLDDRFRVPSGSFPTSPLIVEGWYMDPEIVMAVACHGPGTRLVEGTIRQNDDHYEFDMNWHCGDWKQIGQRLRLVRGAVNHYVAYREGSDLVAAWTAEGFDFKIEHDFAESPGSSIPSPLRALGESPQADAWRVFTAVHAHILRDHFPTLTVWLSQHQASLKVFAQPCSLASALVGQLHNFIVDGLEIRRCANETCGRPFTRQRGRALKGQYRNTGVIYCDAACAKAQMQREYRRRNRQRAQHAVR